MAYIINNTIWIAEFNAEGDVQSKPTDINPENPIIGLVNTDEYDFYYCTTDAIAGSYIHDNSDEQTDDESDVDEQYEGALSHHNMKLKYYGETAELKQFGSFSNREDYIFTLTNSGTAHICSLSISMMTSLNEMERLYMPVIETIVTSGNHCFFITKGKQLYSMGNNECGALGLGNFKQHKYPRLVPFDKPISSLSCAMDITTLVTMEGEAFYCGYNSTLDGHYKNTFTKIDLPAAVTDCYSVYLDKFRCDVFYKYNSNQMYICGSLSFLLGNKLVENGILCLKLQWNIFSIYSLPIPLNYSRNMMCISTSEGFYLLNPQNEFVPLDNQNVQIIDHSTFSESRSLRFNHTKRATN